MEFYYTLMKDTDNFHCRGEESSYVLNQMNCVLYTWENVIGTRKLNWSYGKAMFEENNLIKVSSRDC